MAANTICFRADAALARELRRLAHQQGQTVSHLVRGLVRLGLGQPVKVAALKQAEMAAAAEVWKRLGVRREAP